MHQLAQILPASRLAIGTGFGAQPALSQGSGKVESKHATAAQQVTHTATAPAVNCRAKGAEVGGLRALSLMDTLGTAIGTGVSGAIVAAGLRATGEVSVGLAVAFAASCVVGLAGFALSGRLRKPRPVKPAADAIQARPDPPAPMVAG